MFTFIDSSPVSLPASSTPIPSGAQEPHQQPNQASVAAQVQESSLDPHYHGSPSSCALASCCQPDAYHQPPSPAHTQEDTVQPWESMPTARAPTAACGSGCGPVFCHRQATLCPPAARPVSCAPAHPQTAPVTSLHCGVLMVRRSSHSSIHINHRGCSWLPWANVCTPPALAITAVCSDT